MRAARSLLLLAACLPGCFDSAPGNGASCPGEEAGPDGEVLPEAEGGADADADGEIGPEAEGGVDVDADGEAAPRPTAAATPARTGTSRRMTSRTLGTCSTTMWFGARRPVRPRRELLRAGLICNESWGICVVSSCDAQPDFTPCEIVTSPDRSYDICSGGACVSPGCGDASCNPPGPGFPLADTGQRLCYTRDGSVGCPGTAGAAGCATTDWCGQDAQYGWDLTHAGTERFTRTTGPEPVVADNVTGLMWMGCPDGRTGDTCTGTDAIYFWPNAVARCDSLSWGGTSDWRLPDVYELESIMDLGTTGMLMDPAAFPGRFFEYFIGFWTSSSGARTLSHPEAWTVHFEEDGRVLVETQTATHRVRCVRSAVSGADAGAPRFRRAAPAGDGQPIVADAATGLVWQGCPAGRTGSDCAGTTSTFDWQSALAYCQGSTWAGLDDWYLPNLIELRSATDDRRESPAIDPAAFPATPFHDDPSDTSPLAFWSSSTWPEHESRAYTVEFWLGRSLWHSKGDAYYVRCVRSGP